MPDTPAGAIVVRGARQHNLKNLDLDLPTGELIVVTGVSGSGKSSLVFDTLYAEGQRRYVETFSPYARQFLDRMDKPQVDRIEGIPPAIAIDQTNPVRTSRSTVGTMTELNDHLKLLFARAASLFCRGCGRAVRRDTATSIAADVAQRLGNTPDARVLLTFPVEVPPNFSEEEVRGLLERQGYTRIHDRREIPAATKGMARRGRKAAAKAGRIVLEVVQDRFRAGALDPARLNEGLEAALRVGRGRVDVRVNAAGDAPAEGSQAAEILRYSSDLHCADCDIHYTDPTPSLFSFNSPVGACATCRGFGRVIGVDYGLVVPDESKTLRGGAIRPWQTESYRECQDDLLKFAKKRGVRTDVPWRDLKPAERDWVIDGEGSWEDGAWYGAKRFFAWLESRAYKMHIRVLLSRYRAYTHCETCGGARLKTDALLWRLGASVDAGKVLRAQDRFLPQGVDWGRDVLESLPGLTVHDLMLLPVDRCREFFARLALPAPLDEAADLVLGEIRTRLSYLVEVGLGYLSLDRQSRTLSGGEVQRINLTTALGTSLVNTLFVLDEPSIGLHPRDMGRVIDVIRRLRTAGNSLLVVEHDPQIMLAADRILDIGPGPGERGGEVTFFGRPDALLRERRSLTADYLAGRRHATTAASASPVDPAGRHLRVLGARQHNLRDLDVDIPLGALVCVTGVSGSGKSTLVEDVLYPALRKVRGQPTEAPGEHRALEGADLIDAVVMVDQSAIGRTTRSNPASYVGAFDAIRKLYAAEPLARERGYTVGTFSFNSGTGRCPTCGGNGFEHVEMQFLSDVYLRCPDCDGKRYRAEVLEVGLYRPGRRVLNIAEVLELTVAAALEYFADAPDVIAKLAPLAAVGLDYLRLGQPVPTLSGGEAQRLKLAGHLANSASSSERGNTLFLFDEPTTGLHFDDVAKLLSAFRQLIEAGHSLLVIEHNLDVIRASDWVIDLGPEGGEAGGTLVFAGDVAALRRSAASHTGVALIEYERALADAGRRGSIAASAVREPAPVEIPAAPAIRVHGAREHNLKDIDVALPRDRFTVVTGVSGSGKSTLAFDIVFAEGQRRYLESLNAYARQFVQPAARPDVDAIFGIPPTVAIEQRTSRGGRKSTVATLTEIYHFLRLLYVKLGVQYCPDCDVPIEPQSRDAIAAQIAKEYRGRKVMLLAPLVVARKGYYTDLAKWAAARGHAALRVDGELIATEPWPRLDRYLEHTIELPVAELVVEPRAETALREALASGLELGKGVLHLVESGRRQAASGKRDAGRGTSARAGGGKRQAGSGTRVFSTRRACPSCGTSFAELDPRLFSFNSKHGWCPDCFGTGVRLRGFDAAQTGEESAWNEDAVETTACASCDGSRLNPVARNVRFDGHSIAALTAKPVSEAARWFGRLRLDGRASEIARDILAEVRSRLAFLADVGLGYLALERAAPTLSGGEAQRIRLAAQLGSNLQGVCYVLDEPTIGLHPRDNRILLDTLERLGAKGNTLLVVEHDEETIRRADHVIDLGPGAGTRGGRLVAQGTAAELERAPDSVTGRFLSQPLRHPLARRRGVTRDDPVIEISGAELHNLRGIDVRVPLARLVVVTGVSGSGKSTLARDILHDNLRVAVARRGRRGRRWQPAGCAAIGGFDSIERVLEVDQTPIGKTPRSCPATYVGFWDAIRRLYANTTEARMRGYDASRFSFNTPGGRCDACEGQGQRRIEMSFLPEVKLLCDVCGGRRFGAETLEVVHRGRSIGDVLMMSVEEATDFFAAHRNIHRPLVLLKEVGLGYLTLGQQSPTLSGGEAQRIKLVTELAKVRGPQGPLPRAGVARSTLYVLDEPTVGLHMADVEKLITVLHRLIDAGSTVVVIEHNLDVIAEADWIIDLGPEGGAGGGRIVAQGSPEAIARSQRRSHTARVLCEFLRERETREVAR
jgi:excinuclease ABC subunit A